jgi:multidrug efflux system membrane fusion protein
MSTPSQENGKSAGNKSLSSKLAEWPVVREIITFIQAFLKHNELDKPLQELGDHTKAVWESFLNSPSSTRFWVTSFLVVASALLFTAVVYNGLYNNKLTRILHLPMPVDALEIAPRDLETVVGASAMVQQYSTVTVTSRLTGDMDKVVVNIGDIIKKNDPLFQVKPEFFQAGLEASKARLQSKKSASDSNIRKLEAMRKLKEQGLASLEDIASAEWAMGQGLEDVAEAQQALINSEADLDFTQYKSPLNGIVLSRLVNDSERVILNQTMLRLGDLENVYVIGQVGEEAVAQIWAGADAEVIFAAFPGQVFNGKVVLIDPKTDSRTRTFPVYVKVANPDLKLKPGVSGFIRVHMAKKALAVPNSAIVNPVGENASVFVVGESGHAALRPVRIGMVAQGWTEIVSGVSEKEKIVTVGLLYLKDNDSVWARVPQK